LPSDDSLLKIRASVYGEKPKKDIYSFIGNFTRFYGDNKVRARSPLDGGLKNRLDLFLIFFPSLGLKSLHSNTSHSCIIRFFYFYLITAAKKFHRPCFLSILLKQPKFIFFGFFTPHTFPFLAFLPLTQYFERQKSKFWLFQ
jgi:hypothetical protein